MPSGARIPYGQRFFHPIYAAAVEHGLPIAIHPGTEGVGISGAPTAAGYPGSYLEWHTGLVGSFIAHLISLVTEGVFIKFPKLKFVLVEGGVCWLPPLLWRWQKLAGTPPDGTLARSSA
jgi:predicted TIM-barrel fold metal-dependent hydrolase